MFTYDSIKEKTHYLLELALLQALFLYKNKENIQKEVKNRIDYSKRSACNFTMKSFALCNALILLGYVGFLDKDTTSFILKLSAPVFLLLSAYVNYDVFKNIRKWRYYNNKSIIDDKKLLGSSKDGKKELLANKDDKKKSPAHEEVLKAHKDDEKSLEPDKDYTDRLVDAVEDSEEPLVEPHIDGKKPLESDEDDFGDALREMME